MVTLKKSAAEMSQHRGAVPNLPTMASVAVRKTSSCAATGVPHGFHT